MKDTRACKTWQALAGVALGVCVGGEGFLSILRAKCSVKSWGRGIHDQICIFISWEEAAAQVLN